MNGLNENTNVNSDLFFFRFYLRSLEAQRAQQSTQSIRKSIDQDDDPSFEDDYERAKAEYEKMSLTQVKSFFNSEKNK